MVYRGLQTKGLWLKLLPFLALLTFSSSEARYALTHTLEQLFPAQICVDGCKAHTTTSKAAFVQQAGVVQGSSSLTHKPTDISARVQTKRLEFKQNALEVTGFITPDAMPRAPPQAV
jgi:hypothetical protein